MFYTPILLLVFNRPDHTRRVLARIREIAPSFLYVAADGPRDGNVDDKLKCELTREIIMHDVDWPCQVKTLFQDRNLGCGLSPANGITWFFQQVDAGIILEDDCLPSISFFSFSSTLLEFYKDDHQIMHISGNNFQNGIVRGKSSYYFSAYTHNWGWATWRNRWAFFDFDMKEFSEQIILDASKTYGFRHKEILFWQKSFHDVVANNRIDIWDFRWMYSVWKNKGISILPQVNLIKNIGFDQYATHTHNATPSVNIETVEIDHITHPPAVVLNREADFYTFKNHFNPQLAQVRRMANIVYKVVRKIYSSVEQPIRYQQQFKRFHDFTMVPKSTYIANLELSSRFKNIPGDVVECGTWKGGMIAAMVDIMGAERTYHLFDSFEGLPEVKEIDGASAKVWQSNKNGVDYFNNCKADVSDAKIAMKRSGAKNYFINKGWFNQSLTSFNSPNGIAVLRLDADWYDSTMDCLIHLFPKINSGGVLILDDYYTWEGCAKAIHDYLSINKLPYRINSYEGICYIVKQ